MNIRISLLHHNDAEEAGKPGDRGTPAMLIGYLENKKAYKQLDPESKNVVLSPKVSFDEMVICINC